MGFQHLSKKVLIETGRKGFLSTYNRYGYEHFLKLGELARKKRMLVKTKKKLIAWHLPEIGTIKIRKPSKKRKTINYLATWAYKKRGKYYYKHLGLCDKQGFPLY